MTLGIATIADFLLQVMLPLAGAGLLAGFLAGLFGVGGGVILTPALYALYLQQGVDPAIAMHVAVGTTLATIAPTSLNSARGHARRGSVDWAMLKGWAPAMVFGVVIGTLIAGQVTSRVLLLVFGGMLTVVSLYMILAADRVRLAKDLPGPPWREVIGGTIGTISTMVGIGGTSMLAPTMVLCGRPMRQAVGSSAAMGSLVALCAMLGFMAIGAGASGRPDGSLGYVNLTGVLALVPMTLIFTPLGVAAAHRLPMGILRRIFGAFLLLTAFKLLRSGLDAV